MKLCLKIDNWCLHLLKKNNTTVEETQPYKILQQYYDEIEIIYQEAQINHFLKLSSNSKYPVLSLDPLIKSVYNLDISRFYTIDKDGAFKFKNYIVRPESAKIYNCFNEQLINILPDTSVIIYDDDIVYGGQIKFAKSLLDLNGIHVVDTSVFIDNTTLEFEILDFRDLISFSPYGGLPINLVDGRLPYYYLLEIIEHNVGIKDKKLAITFQDVCIEFNKQVKRK